jgi:putative transposase
LLADVGVSRSRTAIHHWVQKANLQPAGGESPDRVAVDQKAIQLNDQQYWLYAAVDPETNRFLHSRLFPTYTIPIAREFLTELAEKHDVDDADDLIDGLRNEALSYRVQSHGYRNQIERVFRDVDRRTASFANCFSHVDPSTAESWLQAHAVWSTHA